MTMKKPVTITDFEDDLAIVDFLDDAQPSDLAAVKRIIPDAVNHKEFLVRASALEAVGDFELKQYLELVRDRLDNEKTTLSKCTPCPPAMTSWAPNPYR